VFLRLLFLIVEGLQVVLVEECFLYSLSLHFLEQFVGADSVETFGLVNRVIKHILTPVSLVSDYFCSQLLKFFSLSNDII